jgi:NADH-quinone oxidoreductase subunit J
MLPGVYVFYGLLAIIIVGTAAGMVISRHAIYSALFLVLNFASVALLYLLLGAPFIALVQITVYAGSIMVLFLFVIMLLGAEQLSGKDPLRGQRFLAVFLGVLFLGLLGLFIAYGWDVNAVVGTPPAGSGSPEAIGTALFTDYALPFEVTGLLLLVATIGAILLTHRDDNRGMFGLTPKKEK